MSEIKESKEEEKIVASPKMLKYFEEIENGVQTTFKIASEARTKGLDPVDEVEVKLAKNMAERVVGLISTLAPQIVDSGVVERIIELEAEYGKLDWRVAFKIAEEIALQKFCKFDTKLEAIEVGVRTGFAYQTVGVVTAPLEGLTNIEEKQRLDGKGTYLCLNFAGPVRNAGGTAAASCVLIADYVRKKAGYAPYDPTEDEIKRIYTEISNYHERVTNLQYYPSQKEMDFMGKNMPLEISGDASESFEVSNYKDLPRIKTNIIRSGYCLIFSSCLPLKAEKLWKQLSKWGQDFEMDQWNFLEEFCRIKKEVHAKGKKAESGDSAKVTPDYTYIADLVAGRPVLGHPLAHGGFRLRYGRSRTSGYSAQSVHPATMHVLNDYLATATQLKVERPGKGAAYTTCDSIEGPIIKIDDGSVVFLDTEKKAKEYKKRIKEVLYLGDVLVNYGDFLNRAHPLVLPGYCEEWWVQEVEKAAVDMFGSFDIEKLAGYLEIDQDILFRLFDEPLGSSITFDGAMLLCKKLKVPLHPRHTYHWNVLSIEQLNDLVHWLSKAKSDEDKIVLPTEDKGKRSLELIGMPHKVVTEHVLVGVDESGALRRSLGLENHNVDKVLQLVDENKDKSVLEIVNLLSMIRIRDKSGVFIGARMGRPEKAKMRKMTGTPHMLFPVGDEGGRLRSFRAAIDVGKVNADFCIRKCDSCNIETPLGICELCGKPTKKMYFCKMCGMMEQDTCKVHGKAECFAKKDIDIKRIFENCLKKLDLKGIPDLIKGVRGTSNKEHIPEHLIKGILRAYHGIFVNKDGTIRYDCSEVPITHFKPKEIGVSVEKLKQMGYELDIKGRSLENRDQVLEIKPQDIIIPCCPDSPDEMGDQVLIKTTQFIDDLLLKLYGLEPFYNVKCREDLVGHLVVGLAPHTSAGSVLRIIGFSKTQGFFCHPYMHAAMRRDCFSYDTLIPIKKNGVWENVRVGGLVESLSPSEVVDDFGTREKKVSGYKTLGLKNGKISEVNINTFTKHAPQRMIEIKTKLGRVLKTTANHKHIVSQSGKDGIVRAFELKKGHLLKIPYNYTISRKNVSGLNLIDVFKDSDWLMVRGLGLLVNNLRRKLILAGVDGEHVSNFVNRDSVPVKFVHEMIKKEKIDVKSLMISAKRDNVILPAYVDLTADFLKVLGLYVAEGYSRMSNANKGYYQVYIAASDLEIREFVKKTFFDLFGLKPSDNKNDRVIFSSRIIYELFVNILCMGSGAYEKRMPKQFLNLPNKRLGALLSGYLEGDGSVSRTDLRVTFDTVSMGLLKDLDFMLAQFGIFIKNKKYTSKLGPKIREFYEKKGHVPRFTVIKGTIQSKFVHKLSEYVSFISSRKQSVFEYILNNKKFRNLFLKYDDNYFYDEIIGLKYLDEDFSYCLNVENNIVLANGILTKQCDGDESCFFLLLDAFLNFSQKYLPNSRGAMMDAPLVLTSILAPGEVDDMAFDIDIVWKYPLEFYQACEEYKKPWDVKMKLINNTLDTEEQYEGMGYTHETDDFNDGVVCSAYKTLPSMEAKLKGQMDIAEKVRAVQTGDVARLVIEKHFIRDTKGNLRKFSQQQFRCVKCNTKYRRPPLMGKCTECGGKILFTISEGSIVKYLQPSISLAEKYEVPVFLRQSLELLKRRVDGVFGKEKDRQEGLGKWFG